MKKRSKLSDFKRIRNYSYDITKEGSPTLPNLTHLSNFNDEINLDNSSDNIFNGVTIPNLSHRKASFN
jgi:hypothetical protein